VSSIQNELEAHSEIDLTSALNDRSKYPFGSYSYLEHMLIKLGTVTEIPARIADSEISQSISIIKEDDIAKKRKLNDVLTDKVQTAAHPSPTTIQQTKNSYWAKVNICF